MKLPLILVNASQVLFSSPDPPEQNAEVEEGSACARDYFGLTFDTDLTHLQISVWTLGPKRILNSTTFVGVPSDLTSETCLPFNGPCKLLHLA